MMGARRWRFIVQWIPCLCLRGCECCAWVVKAGDSYIMRFTIEHVNVLPSRSCLLPPLAGESLVKSGSHTSTSRYRRLMAAAPLKQRKANFYMHYLDSQLDYGIGSSARGQSNG